MKLNPTFSKSLALIAPVTLLTVSNTLGALDYFLKFEGIKGESIDEKHKDEIQIESFSWGVSQMASAGGGAGKVSMQDFHFTARVDKSSPKLMLACCTGNHIPEVKFVVARTSNAPTGGREDYYVITLSDVLVSSYQSSSSPSPDGVAPGPLTAAVKCQYTKIKFDYIAPDSELVSATYDSTTTATTTQPTPLP